jgi:stress-induced morphogen
MIAKKDYAAVGRELQDYLRRRFDDATVQIGDDIHYKGTNIVVTSSAFAGLLAEQRFHHVVRALPKEFYEEHLRSGAVWFELAPGEAGIDLMKMPRASDVAGDADRIRDRLEKAGFPEKFQAHFEAEPQRASITHFKETQRILSEAGWSEKELTRACLFMILQGAYCDAHVLMDVLPELTSGHAA